MREPTAIETYRSDLGRYSLEQLRQVPGPGVWSLGQLYNHVILTALDYLDQAERCAESGEEVRLGKTEAGEALFRAGGFPPIRIKLPDGPENSPSNSDSRDDLLRGLEHVAEETQAWKRKLAAVNPNCKVRHDGFGWLNAREWFELVDMHFRHHLRQKQELEERLGL